MTPQPTLNKYIQQSLVENSSKPAFTDFKESTLSYAEVAVAIERIHLVLKAAGIKPGDRIALCGRNCSRWSVMALASMTYGAVTVPLLHEFPAETVTHLVNHCGAKMLLVDKKIADKLNFDDMPKLEGMIRIADNQLLDCRNEELKAAMSDVDALFAKAHPNGFDASQLVVADTPADATMLINYTSGSMGFSKGVMLSERALWSNIQYCIDGLTFLKPGDTMVSMLPLAHMYGFVVEMVHPFVKGCHITFMTRTPSPKVILEAFATVRPKLIVAVPLIIEKIIKTRVFPKLRKPAMRVLLAIPGINTVIRKKIRAQLIDAFGGNLLEMILGGAGLDKDVERFLRSIRFPFTVGYGMTECAPLISYCPWSKQRPGSCGRVVDRMELRVDSPDATTTPGVLWVRGDNVMQGYYDNPEATESTIVDGWMCTGDICQVDADGYIYIRGRDKNMILGPSGQNIYPEEIEQKINNLPWVMESLVVDAGGGKLRALVVPDREAAAKAGLDEAAVDKIVHDELADLNKTLAAYERISDTKIMDQEFEKTPKRSIKRYLYK